MKYPFLLTMNPLRNAAFRRQQVALKKDAPCRLKAAFRFGASTRELLARGILTLNLAVLLLAGCSSTPSGTVDTGPIRATSYSFIAGGAQRTAPEFAERRQHVHTLIQEAITQNLTARGLSRQASGGDVIVAYLVIVGNNASTEAISTYFGYGRDAAGLAEKAHAAYTSNDTPNQFEAGTLLIDLIEAKTNKLLKRSFVVRPMLRNPTAEVQAKRIQEAVDTTLQDLRIAR